jgi:hypothetical protein
MYVGGLDAGTYNVTVRAEAELRSFGGRSRVNIHWADKSSPTSFDSNSPMHTPIGYMASRIVQVTVSGPSDQVEVAKFDPIVTTSYHAPRGAYAIAVGGLAIQSIDCAE